jgi:hypothetical protein
VQIGKLSKKPGIYWAFSRLVPGTDANLMHIQVLDYHQSLGWRGTRKSPDFSGLFSEFDVPSSLGDQSVVFWDRR